MPRIREPHEPMALLSTALFADSASAHADLASLASSGVDVDFDASVLVHIGVFLVLLVVLKPLLFDPMLALFEERERRTLGTKGSAKALDDESERARTEVESKMAAARAEGNEKRNALRAQAAKEEAEILAKAREEVDALTARGRKANADARAAAQTSLEAQSQELASLVAARALGREVGR
jgi:F-type H+-transporting ATPase subunit b